MPKQIDPITLAIDFDGVIHDAEHPRPTKRMGLPLPGATQAMRQLEDRGFKLVIFSEKARTADGTKAIEDWCKFFEIPYHEVTAIKPNAVLYLDDKALRFIDWQFSMEQIWDATGLREVGEEPPELNEIDIHRTPEAPMWPDGKLVVDAEPEATKPPASDTREPKKDDKPLSNNVFSLMGEDGEEEGEDK